MKAYVYVSVTAFVALCAIIVMLQFTPQKPPPTLPRKPVQEKTPEWMVMTPGAKPCHVHPFTYEEAMDVAAEALHRQFPTFKHITVVAPCRRRHDGKEGWVCEYTVETEDEMLRIQGPVSGLACDR